MIMCVSVQYSTIVCWTLLTPRCMCESCDTLSVCLCIICVGLSATKLAATYLVYNDLIRYIMLYRR